MRVYFLCLCSYVYSFLHTARTHSKFFFRSFFRRRFCLLVRLYFIVSSTLYLYSSLLAFVRLSICLSLFCIHTKKKKDNVKFVFVRFWMLVLIVCLYSHYFRSVVYLRFSLFACFVYDDFNSAMQLTCAVVHSDKLCSIENIALMDSIEKCKQIVYEVKFT